MNVCLSIHILFIALRRNRGRCIALILRFKHKELLLVRDERERASKRLSADLPYKPSPMLGEPRATASP